ncbi:HNH endonuclease [Glaciihabitans tibetensis]|uniref:HNH endonuclease n=1 Tax=Glaciihabitans tibetensis TaxID=1266600 RepID=A0A2T0VI92_9MICO|nr:HNH endonuclease signature motif containing protein [Glaciihabitans tibetensis]PRY69928.1 HNH endonuclease [Glaciihabitans tibetensis]
MAFTGFRPTAHSTALPLDAGASVGAAVPLDAPEAREAPDGAAARVPGGVPLDEPAEAAADLALAAAFRTALAVAGQVPTEVALYDLVDNATVTELHQLAAGLHRLAGTLLALTAGQIQRRSAPELGAQGMARQGGHRTPEEMTKAIGKLQHQDAARAIRQGRLIHETQTLDVAKIAGSPPPLNPTTGEEVTAAEPWLVDVGRALTRGMSLEAAESIRRGLGVPTEGVSADALRAAARQLCREAVHLDPDRLYARARRLRDELDFAGIGLREEERRQKRSLTVTRQRDGMARMVWIMDPETYAVVGEVYDRATSPRRGGPRTSTGAAGELAARIAADDRTTEQLASDSFAQLLQNGVATDPSMVLGTGTPSVRILTTRPLAGGSAPARCPGGVQDDPAQDDPAQDGPAQDYPAHHHIDPPGQSRESAPEDKFGQSRVTAPEDRFGPGWIEGQQEPVSAATVARVVCTGTTSTVEFDTTGQPIDVASEQRLYSRKQRQGLGARDGGCRWGDASGVGTCDRPPSWTEAHHIEQWDRDGGRTTIVNGILLCKHHHLTLHNDGWEIHRRRSTYWLIPPRSVDPAQTPRLMPTRSPAYLQLQQQRRV